jgi:FkbM family methyltransferase
MSYALRLFRTESFKKAPVATVYRAVTWILFHIVPKRHALITVPVGNTSFKLNLPPLLWQAGSTSIFVQRQYYEPLLQFGDRLVKHGDVVFDCGANQGIYACAFGALVGRSGKVISFEPQDYAVAALQSNAQLNGFGHVSVEHAAVSDHEGIATLDISRGAVSGSIVRDGGHDRVQSVPTVTLDSVCERLRIDRLNLLKMDIEGAELLALNAAQNILKRFRPIIVLEANPNEAQWPKIMTLLELLGYEPYLFGVDGRLERIDTLPEDHPDVVFMPNAARAP